MNKGIQCWKERVVWIHVWVFCGLLNFWITFCGTLHTYTEKIHKRIALTIVNFDYCLWVGFHYGMIYLKYEKAAEQSRAGHGGERARYTYSLARRQGCNSYRIGFVLLDECDIIIIKADVLFPLNAVVCINTNCQNYNVRKFLGQKCRPFPWGHLIRCPFHRRSAIFHCLKKAVLGTTQPYRHRVTCAVQDKYKKSPHKMKSCIGSSD